MNMPSGSARPMVCRSRSERAETGGALPPSGDSTPGSADGVSLDGVDLSTTRRGDERRLRSPATGRDGVPRAPGRSYRPPGPNPEHLRAARVLGTGPRSAARPQRRKLGPSLRSRRRGGSRTSLFAECRGEDRGGVPRRTAPANGWQYVDGFCRSVSLGVRPSARSLVTCPGRALPRGASAARSLRLPAPSADRILVEADHR